MIKVSKVPAHLVEEAVGFCHPVELMFMLLQKINVTLLWDKLQQLMATEKRSLLHELKLILVDEQGRSSANMIQQATFFLLSKIHYNQISNTMGVT